MSYIRKNSNIVKGDELWMFLGASGSEQPIAFSTNHSLNWSLNTSNVSSKDHGNTSCVIPGEATWSVSTEALFSLSNDNTVGAAAFDDLMTLKDSSSPVSVKFGKISNYTAQGIVDVDSATNWTLSYPYWSGEGFITSLQASGSHGDSATMSIEISGNGPLTKVTA